MDLSTDNAPVVSDTALQPVEKRPGVWSGLGIVALYFLLQFGIAMLAGGMIAFVFALKAGIAAGMHHTKPDTHAIAQLLQTNPDLRVILTVVTIAAAAVVMGLLVRQFWPAQWSRAELPGFGFTPTRDKLWYPGAVGLGVVVLLAGTVLTHLLAGQHPINQDVSVMAAKPLGTRLQ